MFYQPEDGRGWVVLAAYHEETLLRVLDEMMDDPESAGFSDIGIRNILYTEVLNTRPRRVLEIGTHIGTGAVVMGTALQRNGYGKLISLEPQLKYKAIAEGYIARAGLSEMVEILPFFSYQDECQQRLRAEGPFDLIFIDGAHEYEAALFDIRLAYALLRENGLIILHDSGRDSPQMDQSGQGGVRRAVHDFAAETPGAVAIFREHPLWLNPCGAALICKQLLEPAIETPAGA
ncbi:MAG: hypothetical protein JWM75_3089 [Sphingomonas bacterium]|nr:hypothetical protein [Sphingomonas bacterium]